MCLELCLGFSKHNAVQCEKISKARAPADAHRFDNIVDMVTGSAFSILTSDVEHSIPAITVTGKAFFDAGHSVKDQRLEAIFPATQPGRFIRW
jgi:hypothetical protein